MDPDHLTPLLAAAVDADAQQSADCPDEHLIAGYVDGTLDASACEQLERHAADCSHCLGLIGLLSRERGGDVTELVPAAVIAQACAVATERPQRRQRYAPQWAAAAVMVLAVPLLVQIGRNLERGAEGQGRPAPAATRTVTPDSAEIQVVTPLAGSAVDPRMLSVRWSDVVGTPYYDVRIVTDAGDVVVQERVTGTTWQLPSQLELQPGAEYYVHVDAYPSGDKAVSSEHVPFRVAE